MLSLLAGLFFGIPGLVGAVTSYIGLRAVGPKLPRAVAAAVALALGVLTIITVQAVLAQL